MQAISADGHREERLLRRSTKLAGCQFEQLSWPDRAEYTDVFSNPGKPSHQGTFLDCFLPRVARSYGCCVRNDID